ncbi:hypothetical protein T3828_32440, partial [Pseudomonas aeruginosa]|nr:hypothetical protein [Pseudomonas aeruginosa]
DGDAHLALRTIAEFPCPEQDNMPAANMRQIALAALSGAGASSEPGNPGGEPVSGPGNAGERPHPAPGSGDSKLAESLQTLVRWLDRAEIEDGYVGVPVIEAVEVVVNELRRLQAEVADWQEAAGRSRSDVMAYIAERAKLLEEHDVALAEVGALKAELQSQRERNTELIFKLGSATNGWGRCEKERDAAQARCAELKAELAMANDAAAKGDAARHQCAGMEMEIKELRGAAEHWEAESRALQKLLDAALAKLAELEKQEPVAAVSEETFSANGTSDIITRNLPIGTTLYAAPVAPAQHSVPQAWLDVQAERRRQITAEGWTPEHDDEHSHGQMARAAACYALAGSSAPNDGTAALLVSLAWPWDEQWWKPTTTRRDLVKACALGLAEIERLDRAAAPGKEVGHE